MKFTNERAVSPVVGVMLMLVVTIIIAAVVAAFAGGAVTGVKKAPQATIGATYSISTGMKIMHEGGDPLPTSKIVFMINDGPTFGESLDQLDKPALEQNPDLRCQRRPDAVYGWRVQLQLFSTRVIRSTYPQQTQHVTYGSRVLLQLLGAAMWHQMGIPIPGARQTSGLSVSGTTTISVSRSH